MMLRNSTASLLRELRLLGIAAVCVTFIACRGPLANPPGTIQVDLEDAPTATDPRFSTSAASSRVNELIFSSLVRPAESGEFVGQLAESFERRGATQIVFHLRRGVRFSNGNALTARDVKYTFDSILDQASKSPKRGALQHLKSIDAPDDYTIVMTTIGPYAPAVEMGTQGIVPAGTPPPSRSEEVAPPGAGPFRMVSFSRDESVVLERNPYYPSAPNSPRRIVFKIVPDPTVRALELIEGVSDLSENNIQPDVLPTLAAQPHLSTIKSAGTGYRYIAFNFRHDPRLRDIRVRRAIAYSIDRNAIVNSMMRGTARIATGLLTPENWAYSADVTTYSYDPAKARELLEQAGYPVVKNGMRDLRLVFKTTPEQLRLATALQSMLKDVGIELDIRSNEFATFYADTMSGNFDLVSMYWVGVNDPNHYYMIFDSKMTPPRGYNRGYYSNPEMDRLVESAQTTFDINERRKLYARVQQIAADDLPYVSLWWEDNVVVLNRALQGFVPYPNGSLKSLATVTLTSPAGAEPAN
jgi:peptide/nickel transport system substrate-binding protein